MESIMDNSSVTTVREINTKVCEILFNSSNKFHLTIHQTRRHNGNFLICMKGAPEQILEKCTSYVLDDGVHPIDDGFKKGFDDTYKYLGGMGERVIALCMFVLPKDMYPLDFAFDVEPPNFPISGFHFVGLISMVDPPKPGVRSAVIKCRQAGIKIVMVTGDHPITAQAIAKSVGIISKSKLQITTDY